MAAAEGPVPAQRPAGDEVLVFYPPGDCAGELELEVYDRAAGAWRPHPRHPRLAPGACAFEPPGGLLNELRVRCADPAGKRAPSAWVEGAEVASAAASCNGPVVR
ncbi:MAG TPA: hypothetical protein VII78_20045 [Myxococcota bacterium]